MKLCLECSEETKNPKFCNSSCAAKFNNRNRIDKCVGKEKTKKSKCVKCGYEIKINLRASKKTSLCNDCKKITSARKCTCCGQDVCTEPYICRRKQLILGSLHKYFGFDITTVGTRDVYKEFYRIENKIKTLYSNKSLQEICDLIGYPNGASNLWNTLKIFNIQYRNNSEAQKRALLNGNRNLLTNYKSKYRQGWHTTWVGTEIFYRSSYELEYAKQLDRQKINYEVESLRIEYWDSQENSYRIAIPDFYLPDTNEIVEIKSAWTYDEQNMKDRVKKFYDLGYSYKLIFEKVEYLEPVTI